MSNSDLARFIIEFPLISALFALLVLGFIAWFYVGMIWELVTFPFRVIGALFFGTRGSQLHKIRAKLESGEPLSGSGGSASCEGSARA